MFEAFNCTMVRFLYFGNSFGFRFNVLLNKVSFLVRIQTINQYCTLFQCSQPTQAMSLFFLLSPSLCSFLCLSLSLCSSILFLPFFFLLLLYFFLSLSLCLFIAISLCLWFKILSSNLSLSFYHSFIPFLCYFFSFSLSLSVLPSTYSSFLSLVVRTSVLFIWHNEVLFFLSFQCL